MNYKKNGNRVTGWKHTDNKIVNYPLEHFKVNEKDFIIKLDKNNKIELFARNGSSRTKFKLKVRNYKIDNNSKIYSLKKNYFGKVIILEMKINLLLNFLTHQTTF